MKNQIKLMCAVFFLLAFSCEKNDPVKKADDKCGKDSARFIRNWCVDRIAIVEVLSQENIGEKWTWNGKNYQHAVLAILDSTLLITDKDWGKVTSSVDSVFYFNYTPLEQIVTCKMCCPPTRNISITSFASFPCQGNNI
ncbi:MAG: hypothetical protein ACKO96_12440 [Flammeovirgaceae bacterium]